MKRKAVLVVVLLGSLAGLAPGEEPPPTSFEQGLEALRAGDLATARDRFADAVAEDPDDPRARLALTAVRAPASLADDAALRSLLESYGLAISGDASAVCDLGAHAPETLPDDSPRSGEALATFSDEISAERTGLDEDLASYASELEAVVRSDDLPFCLRPDVTRTVETDASDRTLGRAALALLEGATHLLAGYDLDLDVDDVGNHDRSPADVLAAEPDLLRRISPSSMTLARDGFERAADLLAAGVESIRAEDDPQDDDLFWIAAGDEPRVDAWLDRANRLRDSLRGPATFAGSETGLCGERTFDLGRLFDGEVEDLRPFLPPTDGEGRFRACELPDPTFGGAAPDLTITDVGMLLGLDCDADRLPDDQEGCECPRAGDPDSDDDGVPDGAEWDQGTDPCNPDSDGDGHLDGADNCPWAPNADQADTDGDGTGDECDFCPEPGDWFGCPRDSDWDGIPDVDEEACGSDPFDYESTCEVCHDGVDNDRDGAIDEGCVGPTATPLLGLPIPSLPLPLPTPPVPLPSLPRLP